MTKRLVRTVAAGCMALFVFDKAHAETAGQVSPNQYLVARIQAGSTPGRYLQSLRADLLRLDANGNGAIDIADAGLLNALAGASYRANSAQRLMNADLDGDGIITETELRQKLEYENRMSTQRGVSQRPLSNPDEPIAQELSRLMAADIDKDGRITWNEMIEFTKTQDNYAQNATSSMASSVRQLLSLAQDGRTSISIVDVETIAAAIFAAVDSDGNGTISQDEVNEARSRADRARREEQVRIDCGVPAASERSTVVLLGTYESNALSSIAIGSQASLTGAATITVEPGEQPIYLLVASHQPTIWRFEGATERIERAVVTTTQTGVGKYDEKAPPWAGVTGLSADRVSYPPKSGCFSFFTEAPSIDSAKAVAAVKQQVKKDVDVAVGLHTVAGFGVPSGKAETSESQRVAMMAKLRRGGPIMSADPKNLDQQAATGDVERNFRQLTPGGLIEIDANSVVASTSVMPYDVRPQEAGLVQLMQSGALTRNQRGEFLIHKQMRFPTALVGRHAAKFLLLRGVPMPEGDAGDSLIVSEETGEAIVKRR